MFIIHLFGAYCVRNGMILLVICSLFVSRYGFIVRFSRLFNLTVFVGTLQDAIAFQVH